jgi:hypothetical protein
VYDPLPRCQVAAVRCVQAGRQDGLPTGRGNCTSATHPCPTHPSTHPPSSTARTSSTLLTGFQASPGTRSCPGASWPAPMPDTYSGRRGVQTRTTCCEKQEQQQQQRQQRQQQRWQQQRWQLGIMPAAAAALTATGWQLGGAHIQGLLALGAAAAPEEVPQRFIVHLEHAAGRQDIRQARANASHSVEQTRPACMCAPAEPWQAGV